VLALWRGLGPVLGKQGTNSAVRFGTYGVLQEWVGRRWPGVKGGVGGTVVVGAVSGVVTVYASMPFDNIKTRMQSIGNNYRGLWDCAKRMLAAEGVTVFWRGTTPRLVRVMVCTDFFVFWAAYSTHCEKVLIAHRYPDVE
jgi:solute carrier family 25 citrate transporter 1